MTSIQKINTAVLLIAFNRPDTTRKVLDCIRKAAPPRLYIAADGPRGLIADDQCKCNEVRALKDEVDWECAVETLYSEKNLGCKNGVISAINWFFENEVEGIILEDDILPHEGFFSYCESLLERYRSDQNVKAILGFNFHGQNIRNDSYFFYEGFYPWGWATWKRSWAEYSGYNFDIEKIRALKLKRKSHVNLYNSLELNLRLIYENILDTWDYQYLYMLVSTNGVVIAPHANLTKNIGVNGAHSINNSLNYEYGIFDSNNLVHPSSKSIDHRMNGLFLEEHRLGRRKILIKKLLLDMAVYKFIKKIRNKIFHSR